MARFRKRRILLACLFVFVAVCLGVGYGYVWMWDGVKEFAAFIQPADCLYKSGNSISPQWFRDFAGIDLPPGARNVSAACEVSQDYVAYVRFAIDPGDLNRLIASSLVKTPLSSSQKPYDMVCNDTDMKRQGWNIVSITLFLAGEGNSPGGRHQSILIDTSNATQYVVYVVTFSV